MLYERDYAGDLERCKRDSTLGWLAKTTQKGLGAAAGAAIGLLPGVGGYVVASKGVIIGAGGGAVGSSLVDSVATETGDNVAIAMCQRMVCPKK